MKSFAEIDIETKGDYLKLLSAVAKLSGLFSEKSIPFISYRVAENIFCRSFDAHNLARADGAFDAKYNSMGIGIKTFGYSSNNKSEKIAEFGSLSSEINGLSGEELAKKVSEYRNERINLGVRLYDVKDSLYHIVARKENELSLFETDYGLIDIENIHQVQKTKAGWSFEDGNNFYSYSYSKSTLFRRFIIPQNVYRLPVEIIEEPYRLLLELFEDKVLEPATDQLIEGVNFVILPLYGMKDKQKFVFENSGLNQWHAKPRASQESRGLGEMYIPIPSAIHQHYPDFFPSRDIHFNLTIPTGEIFKAKVCQDNSKALMTNPNKALSDWLLRRVLNLKEGELATIEKMNILGFDSVIIQKNNGGDYTIDKAKMGSYEKFMSKE